MPISLPFPTMFPVEIAGSGEPKHSFLVALENGRMLAVWYSSGPVPGANSMVYGRIVGADGLPAGEAFEVAEYVAGYHFRPYVTVLSDGGFAIGWNSFDQFPVSTELGYPYVTAMVRKFDSNGIAVTGEDAGPTIPTTGQPIGGVFALANGGYAVSFYRHHEYLARFFDANGVAVSNDVLLNAPIPTGTYHHYNLAVQLESGRLLSYTPYEAAQDFVPGSGYRTGVVMQLFSADGTVIMRRNLPRPEEMQVTALDGGGFVVNWGINPEGSSSIQGGLQFFNANMTALTPRILPNTPGTDEYFLETIVLPNGNIAAISWAVTGSGARHFLSIYSAEGQLVRSPVILPPEVKDFAFYGGLTKALPDGSLMLVGGPNGDLFGQILSLNGQLDSHKFYLGENWNRTSPVVTISTTGVIYYLTQEYDLGALDGLGGVHLVRLDLMTLADTTGPFSEGDDLRRLEIGGSFQALAGDDRVLSSDLATTIDGGAGDDLLMGGMGRDVLYGGLGNDTLQSQFGAAPNHRPSDRLFGGAGDDLITVNGYLSPTVAEQVHGGAGNDRIHDALAYRFYSNRESYGGTGDDYILSSGDKYGGSGNDTLAGLGIVLDGGEGNDLAVMVYEDFDSDTGEPSGPEWVIDLESEVISENNQVLVNSVEAFRIIGTIRGQLAGNAADNIFITDLRADSLIGRNGHDFLSSGAGEDTIFGGNGNDSLYGGSGNDILYAGSGADWVDGGAGKDWLIMGGSTAVYVDLSKGIGLVGQSRGDHYINIEAVIGSNANDTLIGSNSADHLDGASGNDILQGGLGNDTLIASAGDDSLYGGAGIDTVRFEGRADVTVDMRGTSPRATGLGTDRLLSIEKVLTGSGHDRIYGSSGNDVLGGGLGNDTLRGGLGADVFCFISNSGVDLIADFDPSIDRLNLVWSFGSQFRDLALTETARGVWINASYVNVPDQRIFLSGIGAEDLTASNFIFSTYYLW